jgi:hypothetical protein
VPEVRCLPPTRMWLEVQQEHARNVIRYCRTIASESNGIACRLECGEFFTSYAAAEVHYLHGDCEVDSKLDGSRCRWADVEGLYCREDPRETDVRMPEELPSPGRYSDPVEVHEDRHRTGRRGLICQNCPQPHYHSDRYADKYSRAYHQQLDHGVFD